MLFAISRLWSMSILIELVASYAIKDPSEDGSLRLQDFEGVDNRKFEDSYYDEGGNAGYWEGDIMHGPAMVGSIQDFVNRPWARSPTSGKVHLVYTFPKNFSSKGRKDLAKVITEFKEKTCISLKKRTSEPDYVSLQEDGDKCWVKTIGNTNGKQPLNHGSDCSWGNMLHEFMHKLGFHHEHTRPDRDKYITIDFDVIKLLSLQTRTNWTTQFLRCDQKEERCHMSTATYDYGSIMHYNSTSGNYKIMTAKPDCPTNDCKIRYQRTHLSQKDIDGINNRYSCSAGSSCIDKEDWCAFNPDCSVEAVMDSCPKLCKICSAPACVDKEEWCKYRPDCTLDDVKANCPNACRQCSEPGTNTTILISGGWKDDARTASTYAMTISFNKNELMRDDHVSNIAFVTKTNYPTPVVDAFACLCEGRSIIGGGRKSSIHIAGEVKNVYEYKENKFTPLPPLNTPRSYAAAACYSQTIITTGGYYGNREIDSVEVLHLTTSTNAPQWITCKTKMPFAVADHTLTLFRGKLILADGYGKEVFEGTLSPDKTDVTWRSLPSMNIKRNCHMSVNVKNEFLIVMGGVTEKTTEYFNGTGWEMGPSLPFQLGHATAVTDMNGRVIITGGYNYDTSESSSKIIIFHPDKKEFEVVEGYGLREPLDDHISLLQ